jgi:hypothetical protein
MYCVCRGQHLQVEARGLHRRHFAGMLGFATGTSTCQQKRRIPFQEYTHTSSFFFNSFSCLKFAIFASRRALGSLVEIVENVVGASV